MNSHPNEAKLLDHEADGIKELDNLLPRWWVWLFNLSIAFAVIYLLLSHGPKSIREAITSGIGENRAIPTLV